MAAKRQTRKVGDVLKIGFGDGTHSYCQISTNPLVIFFDLRTESELPISEIVRLPIAFKLWVFNTDLKKGVWERLGSSPVAPEHLQQPLTFKQDIINGKLTLYHESFADSNYEREATISECHGLERAAVWEASHVEDRLRDHFNGVENKWVKSMAIKIGPRRGGDSG